MPSRVGLASQDPFGQVVATSTMSVNSKYSVHDKKKQGDDKKKKDSKKQ